MWLKRPDSLLHFILGVGKIRKKALNFRILFFVLAGISKSREARWPAESARRRIEQPGSCREDTAWPSQVRHLTIS